VLDPDQGLLLNIISLNFMPSFILFLSLYYSLPIKKLAFFKIIGKKLISIVFIDKS
jgi:hypothetical protein